MKNILKIFCRPCHHRRPHHWAAFHPGWRANGPGTQYFRTKRHHAVGFYCLRCFCLLPDCRVVPAHPDENGQKSYFAGAEAGLSCCVVWIVYLLEPLPHVAPLDRITYPIADSLALIVMGLLLGRLFGNPAQQADKKNLPFPILPVLTVTACFFAGRMLQYLFLDIYFSFDEKPLETVL